MCIKVFPAYSQDRVNICSSWDEVWIGHRVYSIPPHIIAGDGTLSLPGRKDSFQLSKSGGSGGWLMLVPSWREQWGGTGPRMEGASRRGTGRKGGEQTTHSLEFQWEH